MISNEEHEEYLKETRIKVLELITPICELFRIVDYDYIVDGKIYRETLKLNNTYIDCTGDSLRTIINELISYIVVKRKIDLGAFKNQTIKYLTRHWWKDE